MTSSSNDALIKKKLGSKKVTMFILSFEPGLNGKKPGSNHLCFKKNQVHKMNLVLFKTRIKRANRANVIQIL